MNPPVSVIHPLLACVTIIMGLAVSPAWTQIDVGGTWDMSVKTEQGTATPSISLRQNGEDLTGTYSGQMGTVDLEGSLKGDEIVFTVRLKFRETPFIITYRGRVAGDGMQGTARFGDAGAGEWTAKRRK